MNQTLWDLLAPILPQALRPGNASRREQRKPSATRLGRVHREPSASSREKPPNGNQRKSVNVHAEQGLQRTSEPRPQSAADRYEAMTRVMLERYGIRVRKWRSSMSGVAWYVTYRDGTVARLIEAPKPKGPMSAAVFLHEIGHHAIGFNRFKPRCLEEYHAWMWAIGQMETLGISVTDSVRHRMHQSLHYAVQKARRRGLKAIPTELHPFCAIPPTRCKRVKPARSLEQSS